MHAVCVLTNTSKKGMKGTIELESKRLETIITVSLEGFPQGEHGFHIHEAGDLTEGCSSACAHFNPHGKSHGGPGDTERHVGDLGNLLVKKDGTCKAVIKDHLVKLTGKNSVIGRAFVIHERRDDLGRGGLDPNGNIIDHYEYLESMKTGNAGKRIACGVIGYSRKNFSKNKK